MTAPLATPTLIPMTVEDPLAFNHHWKQARFELSRARINIVAKGRRSGGTQIAKRRGIKMATSNTYWPDFRVVFGAPTHQQAKDIWWDDLKRMLHRKQWDDVKLIAEKPSETELTIRLINGSVMKVAGLDKPERVEGSPINWIFVTEAANVKQEAIEQHIFPMLSERGGGIDLESAPEGRNHFYRWACRAQEEEQLEWMYHHWTSAEVMPYYMGDEAAEAEIAAARERMDELVFNQEYKADFVYFDKRAYYNFDRSVHAVRQLGYDPRARLHLAFDFNIAPGICVAIQEGLQLPSTDNRKDETLVFGEVTIPTGSTTEAVCKRVIRNWGKHKGHVYLYGDPTGGARGSAKLRGSDWDIIQENLKPVFKNRLHMRVAKHAKPGDERRRVNAVNSRLKSSTGRIRMYVDPIGAPEVVMDLDEVPVIKGGTGEINKKFDLSRTHHSDGLGYYCLSQHPVGGRPAVMNKQF